MNELEVEGTVRMCIVALINDYASSMRATSRIAGRSAARLTCPAT
ncbi:hypothetical protein [Paraburkholderia youngii]